MIIAETKVSNELGDGNSMEAETRSTRSAPGDFSNNAPVTTFYNLTNERPGTSDDVERYFHTNFHTSHLSHYFYSLKKGFVFIIKFSSFFKLFAFTLF